MSWVFPHRQSEALRHTSSRVSGGVLGAFIVLISLALAACGTTPTGSGETGVTTAQGVTFDISANQTRITTATDDAIAATVPAEIRDSGTLVIGSGAATGSPPLSFFADDDKTPIGAEVDIAYLVASVLGLKPELQVTSFENLFLGLDSGKYAVGVSNIGVSEERKEKYDFATYRLGLHAFEAKKGSGLKVSGPADIAGRSLAVASGTLQEAIAVRWNEENVAAGREETELKYFQSATDYYLALQSGRVDLFLGPNPSATYHVATAGQTEIVGTVSSSFPVTGLVGVATAKDSGLAAPIRAAIDVAIADGSYAKVLAKWGLTSEAVETSLLNPPGLPKPAAS